MQSQSRSDLRLRRVQADKKSLSSDAQNDSALEPETHWHVSPADLTLALSLVLGGCCTNVLTFEALLRRSSSLGSLITFGQMLFITCQASPRFIRWDKSFMPSLNRRQVPLRVWAVQVLVLLSSSLLCNWSFAYTPLTLQIVFRSSGLPVSMLLGRLFLQKRYNVLQTISIFSVTIGVIVASASRPSSRSASGTDDERKYTTGVCMLTASLLFTGILGLLQEQTYKTYGPCWREGVFYTHLLSLPMFIFLRKDVREGLRVLRDSGAYLVYAANLVTQLVCVSGVNQLASKVSSVSTNLVLTARKALSLCLSVVLFGSEWNYELVLGALLVFFGTLMYASVTTRVSKIEGKDRSF